jgi:hypothetical protein
MGNPEASAAVGAYRTLVPAGLRRRIARRVPPRLRMGLKQLLRRLQALTLGARTVRGIRARRRWPHLFGEDEPLSVLAGRGARIALVRETVSPLGLREANLELVVTLLEEAGIDYFAIRGTSDFRSCLAVAEADRHRVRQRRLGILLARRDRQAFCINDTISDGHDTDRQTEMLKRFLKSYYPVPSPFERKEREVR